MAAASPLAWLLFLFFLPCFSNSCPPQILPCNPSIQIMPPFYLQSDITTNDPPCQSYLKIGCDGDDGVLFFSENEYSLENISYDTNTVRLRVRDPDFSIYLNNSGCGNLYFNLSSPVSGFFDHDIYDDNSFTTGLSSVRCNSTTNKIQSPPKLFGADYKLSYSSNDESYELQHHCSRSPDDSDPSFVFIFLFKSESAELSLQAAAYSRDFEAQPDCFAHSIEVYCEGCKGQEFPSEKEDKIHQEKHFQRNITIGIVIGSAFLLAFFCLLLLFYKRKKLKLASSSSMLLVQRETSDRYFHDMEMARSGYTQIFSYAELEEATEGFSSSRELGDGGFGTVYKGKLKDGRIVAVKRLFRNNYKCTEQFMNEVEILSHLHHPNLVTLYGCTAPTSRELILVYEFVSNGTIADHLHGPHSSKNALTWPVRLSIAIETANALAYLHAVEPPVIHRDVKTTNILLDGHFHVKVADFGLSRLFPLDVTHVSTVPQGTPGYVDPVYHECYHLTDKSDVYSFGVVLVELISSKQAVDLNRSKDEINLANMAVNKIQRSQLDELVDPALGFRSNWEVRCMVSLVAELAFRCLQSDREMRPSIKEVLEALKGIEKGSCSGDKLVKDNITKEETYLLNCDPKFSSDSILHSWKSSSTTPNTSG